MLPHSDNRAPSDPCSLKGACAAGFVDTRKAPQCCTHTLGTHRPGHPYGAFLARRSYPTVLIGVGGNSHLHSSYPNAFASSASAMAVVELATVSA